MYNLLDAHPATVIIVVGSIMVTPVYVLGTYVFSGASANESNGGLINSDLKVDMVK